VAPLWKILFAGQLRVFYAGASLTINMNVMFSVLHLRGFTRFLRYSQVGHATKGSL
jgi:hypothetical protein